MAAGLGEYSGEWHANHIFPHSVNPQPRDDNIGAVLLLLGALDIQIMSVHPIYIPL